MRREIAMSLALVALLAAPWALAQADKPGAKRAARRGLPVNRSAEIKTTIKNRQ